MLILKDGQWLTADHRPLDIEEVVANLSDLLAPLSERNALLADWVQASVIWLTGQHLPEPIVLTDQDWEHLSVEDEAFLEEHLEDILQDLTDTQDNLTETIQEIDAIAQERASLDEVYMEGLAALDSQQVDLEELSQQLEAILALDEDLNDLLLERQRLEKEETGLLTRLSSLVLAALGMED